MTQPADLSHLLRQLLDVLDRVETPARRPTKLRLVRMAEAMERLAVTDPDVFRREFQWRFSDRRPADKRRSGVPVVIPEDELDLAISDGWEALAAYRARLGRR